MRQCIIGQSGYAYIYKYNSMVANLITTPGCLTINWSILNVRPIYQYQCHFITIPDPHCNASVHKAINLTIKIQIQQSHEYVTPSKCQFHKSMRTRKKTCSVSIHKSATPLSIYHTTLPIGPSVWCHSVHRLPVPHVQHHMGNINAVEFTEGCLSVDVSIHDDTSPLPGSYASTWYRHRSCCQRPDMPIMQANINIHEKCSRNTSTP